jgi:hypothetical protein
LSYSQRRFIFINFGSRHFSALALEFAGPFAHAQTIFSPTQICSGSYTGERLLRRRGARRHLPVAASSQMKYDYFRILPSRVNANSNAAVELEEQAPILLPSEHAKAE